MLYEKNSLKYPRGLQWSPPFGEPFEVADGVFWFRVPLPMKLDHINLWLLRDGEQWAIVDTGMYDDGCKAAWNTVFEEFIAPESVSRIVITHYHPDHLGLASWLLERCRCKVLISKPEFEYYWHLRTRNIEEYAERAARALREAGVDEESGKQYIKAFGSVNSARTLESGECEFLDEGAELVIGGRRWRAVSGSGHSPLHLCWYAEDDKLLIAGDQALPRISSNVSVYVDSPDRNPLQRWLESCEKLKREIAPDTLVLPAHQEPFIGIRERMQQLIDDHEKQLQTLRVVLEKPLSIVQASEALFPARLDAITRLLATGETQSHVNYLLAKGQLQEKIDEHGVRRYQRL